MTLSYLPSINHLHVKSHISIKKTKPSILYWLLKDCTWSCIFNIAKIIFIKSNLFVDKMSINLLFSAYFVFFYLKNLIRNSLPCLAEYRRTQTYETRYLCFFWILEPSRLSILSFYITLTEKLFTFRKHMHTNGVQKSKEL